MMARRSARVRNDHFLCDRTQFPEVVKIYGTYSHKQLDHIWPWLNQLLNGCGKVYQARCTPRESAEPGSGVYRPATFLRDMRNLPWTNLLFLFMMMGRTRSAESKLYSIPLERLEISRRGQIRFFCAEQQSPFAEEVYELGEEFCIRGEEAMALMAFNVLSSRLAALHSADAAEFDNFPRRFKRYVRLLISIASDGIPFRATDPEVMKVFGGSSKIDICLQRLTTS